MKISFLQQGMLAVALTFGLSASVSSCTKDSPSSPQKQYPHYLTEFIEPIDFELQPEYRNISMPEPLIGITLTDIEANRVTIFNYDKKNSKISNFLSSIGDTAYLNRTDYDHRSTRIRGIISVPTNFAITCDHDYSSELKAGSLLNNIMAIRYLDHFRFIKRGYQSESSFTLSPLNFRYLYSELLASDPEWHLMMRGHPKSWNDKTVRFTISMTFSLENGEKTISHSVDVKFSDPRK